MNALPLGVKVTFSKLTLQTFVPVYIPLLPKTSTMGFEVQSVPLVNVTVVTLS